MQDAVERTLWIIWLNGAAGAGKSAIAQSIAELCIAHGILVASFFFNRSDPNRNNISRIVATLSYQLTVLLPKIKDIIVDVIESDPLIFEQSFDSQLEKLIITPLRASPPPNVQRKNPLVAPTPALQILSPFYKQLTISRFVHKSFIDSNPRR